MRRCADILFRSAVAVLLVLPHAARAEPTGGNVVSGVAEIKQTGPVTDINQSTQKAIINWQGFSIAPQETVNFNQPSVSSVTLNRVIGNERSVIEGALNANGQVFIVNSAGVLFTHRAQVNVGGLVASTLDISNEDFKAGNYTFSGTSKASVINQGSLSATAGGYISLLGNTVSNQGAITASLGTVALASGSKTTLNFGGNSLIDVTIDQGVLNALVENKQLIRADGGKVILTARAADAILAAQVNNTGIIQARTASALLGGGYAKGRIELNAHGGTTHVSGTLDASAPEGGDGGFIETSGDKVNVADDAIITTKSATGTSGTWLLDPYNIVISNNAAANGSFNGGTPTNTYAPVGPSVVNVAILEAALAGGNVIISTGLAGSAGGDAGNIDVNAAVTWLADTFLTLTAANNININEAIKASGADAGLTLNAGNNININNTVTLGGVRGKLAMNYGGWNGTSVTTPLAGADYNIRTKASYAGAVLDANGNPIANTDTSGGVYGSVKFTTCVDAASCGTRLAINGTNFTLIGSMSQLDALDGQDSVTGSGAATSVIGNFALAQNLDAAGTTYTQALIGANTTTPFSGKIAGLGHTIDNLTINNPSGQNLGVVGYANAVTELRDIGLTAANISGLYYVAPLLGNFDSGTLTVKNAFSSGNVSASFYVSGLIGWLGGVADPITANLSYIRSSADVSGSGYVGSLVGWLGGTASVKNASATGNITGSGNSSFGGLIAHIAGESNKPVTIENTYATGTVTSTSTSTSGISVGGLLGLANYTTVKNSFATGDVRGAQRVGGLIGAINNGSVDNTYATGDVVSFGAAAVNSGRSATGGLIGLVSTADVSNSHATGSVTSTSTSNNGGSVGGLIGDFVRGAITNTYATGKVTGPETRGVGYGGLVGHIGTGSVSDSYATGDVSGFSMVGGLVGMLYDTRYSTGATITNSSAYGNVSGNTNVGGVVGYADLLGGTTPVLGAVVNSHSYGDVTGTGDYVGGVAGFGADVTGSTASGRVTGGRDYVGGIAGRAYKIMDSYFGGVVTGPGANVGALVGLAETSIINSFFRSDTGGVQKSFGRLGTNFTGPADATGLTEKQGQDAQYYMNRTINQVLADRAAAAAAAAKLAAATKAATVTATTGVEKSLETAATPSDAKAGTGQTQAKAGPKLEDTVDLKAAPPAVTTVSGDDRPRRKKRPPADPGADYGAQIKSIDVDGQHFDLEKKNGAPAQGGAAPAPATKP